MMRLHLETEKLRLDHEIAVTKLKDDREDKKYQRQHELRLKDMDMKLCEAFAKETEAQAKEAEARTEELRVMIEYDKLRIDLAAVDEEKTRMEFGWCGWVPFVLWTILTWVLSCCNYQARKFFTTVAGQWLHNNWRLVRAMADTVRGLGANAQGV